MSGGHELHPFYVAHFTYLHLKENNLKRKIYACQYCGEELEHCDNRLTNHISSTSKCKTSPGTACTTAHVLLAGKKSGTKHPAPDEDDPNAASSSEAAADVLMRPAPRKKAKTQSKLDGVVDRPMTKRQEDSANHKLLHYLIHSNTALMQADSIFLADFTNELRPSFNIASCNVMSTLLLDSEHSCVHLESVDVLQNMKRSGTMILDGWEDELRRLLYGSAAGRIGEPTMIMGLQDVTGKRGSADKLLKVAETAMTETKPSLKPDQGIPSNSTNTSCQLKPLPNEQGIALK